MRWTCWKSRQISSCQIGRAPGKVDAVLPSIPLSGSRGLGEVANGPCSGGRFGISASTVDWGNLAFSVQRRRRSEKSGAACGDATGGDAEEWVRSALHLPLLPGRKPTSRGGSRAPGEKRNCQPGTPTRAAKAMTAAIGQRMSILGIDDAKTGAGCRQSSPSSSGRSGDAAHVFLFCVRRRCCVVEPSRRRVDLAISLFFDRG